MNLYPKDECLWQLKESQVITGVAEPERIGYYPILIGLQILAERYRACSSALRANLVSWSLASPFFDSRTNWFIHVGSSHDPADPPIRDIRHTAEVGIALLLGEQAPNRVQQILNNILEFQGHDCPTGAWKSTSGSADADPLSTVICAEFLARTINSLDDLDCDGRIKASFASAMKYLDSTKQPCGWKYPSLPDAFWEVWGASIVSFRLGPWLPDHIKAHAVACLQNELRSTDVLLGSCSDIQRPRLLSRYLCGLHAVGITPPEWKKWLEVLARLWHELAPPHKDMSTRLHLSYLFPHDLPDEYKC